MKLVCIFMVAFIILSCASDSMDTRLPAKEEKSTTIKKNGLTNTYYPSGQLQMSGKMDADGLKNGVWISYFENGQKNSESNFKNGVNNGYSMVWYPNGKVRYFGDYRDGEQVGDWTYYDEEGKVVRTQSY